MAGTWAIIELMGHRQHHGLVTEVSFAGVQMIRVQVPHPQKMTDEAGAELFRETHLYSASSFYGMHEQTETEVREYLVKLFGDYTSSSAQLPAGRACPNCGEGPSLCECDEPDPSDYDGESP